MDFFIPKPTNSINKFISFWDASFGPKKDDAPYNDAMQKGLTQESIKKLFIWKNGMKLSTKKEASVEKNYTLDNLPPKNLEQRKELETYFKKLGTIVWPAFWLHCNTPKIFPIFDQHVFRAMSYLKHAKIEELRSLPFSKQISAYLDDYIIFFEDLKKKSKREESPDKNRDIDRALVSFGAFLAQHKSGFNSK